MFIFGENFFSDVGLLIELTHLQSPEHICFSLSFSKTKILICSVGIEIIKNVRSSLIKIHHIHGSLHESGLNKFWLRIHIQRIFITSTKFNGTYHITYEDNFFDGINKNLIQVTWSINVMTKFSTK